MLEVSLPTAEELIRQQPPRPATLEDLLELEQNPAWMSALRLLQTSAFRQPSRRDLRKGDVEIVRETIAAAAVASVLDQIEELFRLIRENKRRS